MLHAKFWESVCHCHHHATYQYYSLLFSQPPLPSVQMSYMNVPLLTDCVIDVFLSPLLLASSIQGCCSRIGRRPESKRRTDMFGHFGHVNFFVITGQNGGRSKAGEGVQIRFSCSKVRVWMDGNTRFISGVLPFSVHSFLMLNIYFSSLRAPHSLLLSKSCDLDPASAMIKRLARNACQGAEFGRERFQCQT